MKKVVFLFLSFIVFIGVILGKEKVTKRYFPAK